ncbi:hypothetical protein BIW11_02029 [Tropilaelaps mercedesae]|uniref:Uncharacterized protein n=1 Tax=Tropilaelaps mercedesae TaxID=418985 RepID=A0A1V9X444_9ACAR|nr:hypothetical protein BIW11_02029 [Tropilaelaps mercedesae]
MDEIYESRTGVHTENPFLPSEAPAIGTTRKVFVTCEGRGSLDPNASTRIVDAITFFLREKVFPVVGDHCRINIHWDGSDLSTLHVRSVVPNSHLLVLRTAAHNEPSPERAPSSLYFEHGRQVAPLRSPPATVTVKEEPIDFTRKTLLSEDDIKQEINVDRDNASSDDGKRDSDEQVEFSDSEEPIADSHDGLNVSGHSFMESGKPYANFRPVPPMPIPPPISSAAAAYSMYLPQSPMIPMIPLMAFGQSQPYSQAIPLLVPAMQTMPQAFGKASDEPLLRYGRFDKRPIELQDVKTSKGATAVSRSRRCCRTDEEQMTFLETRACMIRRDRTALAGANQHREKRRSESRADWVLVLFVTSFLGSSSRNQAVRGQKIEEEPRTSADFNKVANQRALDRILR